MQKIINIFTILGSILGIFAFFMSISSSVYHYNIEKWKKISSIIDFNDFENLLYGVSIGIIYDQPYDKFKHLRQLISIRSDEIQFKGILKKQIDKQFLEILAASEKIRDEVQVPKWQTLRFDDSRDWIIDKQYIYKESKSSKEGDKIIRESIDQLIEITEKILVNYRKIYSLSNRLPHELLYKLK